MSNFKRCTSASMEQVQALLTEIQATLQQTYDQVSAVQGQINSGAWQGEAQKAMAAYMDLLLQYHGAFVGKADTDAIQEALDALKSFMDNLNGFYDGKSEKFKTLEGIQ